MVGKESYDVVCFVDESVRLRSLDSRIHTEKCCAERRGVSIGWPGCHARRVYSVGRYSNINHVREAQLSRLPGMCQNGSACM